MVYLKVSKYYIVTRYYKFITYPQNIICRGIQPKKCTCKNKQCKGLFIPSRPNQTQCLFEIWRQEKEYEQSI